MHASKRALISVSDKTNLEMLVKVGWPGLGTQGHFMGACGHAACKHARISALPAATLPHHRAQRPAEDMCAALAAEGSSQQ